MTRFIIVIVLALLLVGVALLEQDTVKKHYGRLESDILTLIARIEPIPDKDEGGDIATEENIAMVENMFDYWIKSEHTLSMFARHFDLAQVSTNLIYAKNFIEANNKEEALIGLRQVEYLINTHTYNIGTSIQNVI